MDIYCQDQNVTNKQCVRNQLNIYACMCELRDWSRSEGSYSNTTRLICCPVAGRPDGNYDMTKQLCMKRIYDKILSKSPPNTAPLPTCLHCNVTHLPLTTRIVALHIPSWRVRQREERRQARKTVWPIKAGRAICRYKNHLYGITNHHEYFWDYCLEV